jgi:hypothetical protein
MARRRRARSAMFYGLILLATLLAGPPILVAIGWIYPVDWNPLSSIGQSYTGVSTLFSAGALIAVAMSIRFQATELQMGRILAVHSSQRDLVQIALDDPVYLPCISTFGGSTDEDKQLVYNTLWLRYYEFAYFTGHMAPGIITSALVNERFAIPIVRHHWEKVRHHWHDNAEGFYDLVEAAYQISIDQVGRSST